SRGLVSHIWKNSLHTSHSWVSLVSQVGLWKRCHPYSGLDRQPFRWKWPCFCAAEGRNRGNRRRNTGRLRCNSRISRESFKSGELEARTRRSQRPKQKGRNGPYPHEVLPCLARP